MATRNGNIYRRGEVRNLETRFSGISVTAEKFRGFPGYSDSWHYWLTLNGCRQEYWGAFAPSLEVVAEFAADCRAEVA